METEDALIADELSRAQAGAADALALGEPGGEDDTDDVEHDGQFYKIPRALKGAFLMNADYTRKTQELAEHRRTLERDRQGLAQRMDEVHATVEERGRLAAIEDQMADFAAIDWDALGEEDPQTAQALWARYEDFAQARERYVWSLSQREHHSRAQAQREAAEQLMETGRVLAAEIEGWSPDVASKLVEYAGAFGVTLDELREVADPRLWKILHRAHQGDEMVKQRETAKRTEQLQAIRPAIQVTGGGAAATGVRDELGAGEWMRRRNEQVLKGR